MSNRVIVSTLLLLIISNFSLKAQTTFSCQDPPLFVKGTDVYENSPSWQLSLVAGANTEGLSLDILDPLLELVISFNLAFDRRFSEETINGVRTIVFTPHRLKNDKVILYFHGGAFVFDLNLFSYDMMIDIANRSGSKVYIPFYALAPIQKYPFQINEFQLLYETLLARYGNSEKIVFLGDSAGGNLAISLAAKLRDEGKPLPYQLILLSAWYDLKLDNPEIPNYADLDIILNVEDLDSFSNDYLGDGNQHLKDEPYASPILLENLGDLPETLLLIGTNEIFYPDNLAFALKAEEQGMDIHFIEASGAIHVWPLLPAWFIPESRWAIQQIASFINCSDINGRIESNNSFDKTNTFTENFEVYPNPIEKKSIIDLSRLDIEDKDLLLRITDLAGRVIVSKQIKYPYSNQLEIDHLLDIKGAYIVQIQSVNMAINLSKKIVKQ